MKTAKTASYAEPAFEPTNPTREGGLFISFANLQDRGVQVDVTENGVAFYPTGYLTDAQRAALGELTGGLGLTDREEDALFEQMLEARFAAVVRSAIR